LHRKRSAQQTSENAASFHKEVATKHDCQLSVNSLQQPSTGLSYEHSVISQQCLKDSRYANSQVLPQSDIEPYHVCTLNQQNSNECHYYITPNPVVVKDKNSLDINEAKNFVADNANYENEVGQNSNKLADYVKNTNDVTKASVDNLYEKV